MVKRIVERPAPTCSNCGRMFPLPMEPGIGGKLICPECDLGRPAKFRPGPGTVVLVEVDDEAEGSGPDCPRCGTRNSLRPRWIAVGRVFDRGGWNSPAWLCHQCRILFFERDHWEPVIELYEPGQVTVELVSRLPSGEYCNECDCSCHLENLYTNGIDQIDLEGTMWEGFATIERVMEPRRPADPESLV